MDVHVHDVRRLTLVGPERLETAAGRPFYRTMLVIEDATGARCEVTLYADDAAPLRMHPGDIGDTFAEPTS